MILPLLKLRIVHKRITEEASHHFLSQHYGKIIMTSVTWFSTICPTTIRVLWQQIIKKKEKIDACISIFLVILHQRALQINKDV